MPPRICTTRLSLSTTVPVISRASCYLCTFTQRTGHPSLTEIRAAVEDIFATRTAETKVTEAPSRTWFARLAVYSY
ncbi:hypothetical protein MLPF_0915 [Mycobacterium lepromatosis]|nr:hypothetical protein MLPF_0915 [Mycobacterium lepromatosis]